MPCGLAELVGDFSLHVVKISKWLRKEIPLEYHSHAHAFDIDQENVLLCRQEALSFPPTTYRQAARSAIKFSILLEMLPAKQPIYKSVHSSNRDCFIAPDQTIESTNIRFLPCQY